VATSGRVIVGCTHGEEDPNRVVVSYLTAGAALDQGKDVVMWLSSEGVRLARLDDGRLVANAELKGASPLMEFAGEGATTFTC
jgi:predicted peroxiredoxin